MIISKIPWEELCKYLNLFYIIKREMRSTRIHQNLLMDATSRNLTDIRINKIYKLISY